MLNLRSPIGIVAGNGDYPIEVAKTAKAQGLSVFVIAYHGETTPEIAELADGISWIKVGQLGKLINFFKKSKVTQLTFAGGIKRARLFREAIPDWRGAKLLAKLASRKDDEILTAVAKELEQEGIKVFSATLLLDQFIAKQGTLTKRELNTTELADAKLAWQASKQIGILDVGQSACAYQGTIVALEAIEGTDALINRVGQLIIRNTSTSEAGPVLVKTAKPNQDLRIDLPTVGPDTINNLVKNGFSALVIEAGKTIVLSPEEVRVLADRANLAVVAVETL